MTAASLRAAVASGFGLRLQPWPLKLAYIVVVYEALPFGLSRLLGPPSFGRDLFDVLLNLALFLFAARIFRGRYEDVGPARPWWQVTACAKLSRRLGMLMAIGASLQIIVLVVQAFTQREQVPVDTLDVVSIGVMAYLYLNSAVRLDRLERAAEPAVAPEPGGLSGDVVDVPGPTTRILVTESKATDAGSGSETGLLAPSTDLRRIEVFYGGTRIGELHRLPDVHRDALLRAPGAVRVRLLRTGDLLWAEVPSEAALQASRNAARE